MATKTLTITEGAYERLATLKTGEESFSEVINRITGKVSIMSIAGILAEKEANALESRIKEIRKRSTIRMKRIRAELHDDS